MSIADGSVKGNPDLYVARILAGMGVPIFRCKLDASGNPAKAFGWQNTKPGDVSYSAIDRWEPGWGLGAVCGSVFDVVDVDPRNGGLDSWPLLLSRLADDPPVIFGIQATPSHGFHFLIPAQGVTRCKLLKGIDLQARAGFIFIAPTIRPSKAPGDSGKPRGYRWISPVQPEATPWYHEPSQAFLELPWDAERITGPGTARSGRRSPQELQAAVLAAEAGEQRTALLRLTEEYEFAGWPPEAIRDTLRNFLPSVPVFDPDDPWYPARGGNPDRHINGLIDKYRDGRYRRHGRPIIPDATEDELEGIQDVEPVVVGREAPPAEEAFWTARKDLAIIRQWAQAQQVSPWALLGEILAEVIARVPPTFVLPRIIAGYGTLNMLIALTGNSSAGKGGASSVAEDAVTYGEPALLMKPDRIPLGSGEGLAKNYGYWRKDTGLTRCAYTSIPTCYEIDTFTAIVERGGATLTAELRKFFSGETLGFGYGGQDKRIIIPKYSYRGVLIAGVQPEQSSIILNDTGSGFAQRWFFLDATDPYAPDSEPDRPASLEWTLPRELDELDVEAAKPLQVMDICAKAEEEIKLNRKQNLRGNGDKLRGHALYTQEKFAAGLALLAMRTEITEEDWDLAAYAMRKSDMIRARCEHELEQKRYGQAWAQGKAEGIKQTAAEDSRELEQKKRVARLVMSHVPATGRISRGALGKKMPADREILQKVLPELVSLKLLIMENDTYQGRSVDYYRRPGK